MQIKQYSGSAYDVSILLVGGVTKGVRVQAYVGRKDLKVLMLAM